MVFSNNPHNEEHAMSLMTLGDLADPQSHRGMISTAEQEVDLRNRQLRLMYLIRFAEEKIADKVTDGTIKCPCHLGIGQEAIAVGISQHLTPLDRLFGGHRSHPHFLAQGGTAYSLFAEVLGKHTGCSKGMGGSMHLYDESIGFAGSVPIVGATIPLAVGAGLAAKKAGKKQVAVCYFGDGASEEGALHESLNFAATFNIPILFVCENNLFSSHLHINLRQPKDSIARFAEAHHIQSATIDGNDISLVSDVARKFVASAREHSKPAFLEAVTYRWRGHVGPREDIDVGLKRKDDLSEWKKRDPIGRLVTGLIEQKFITEAEVKEIQSSVREQINENWNQAEADPYPDESATLRYVYKEHKDHNFSTEAGHADNSNIL